MRLDVIEQYTFVDVKDEAAIFEACFLVHRLAERIFLRSVPEHCSNFKCCFATLKKEDWRFYCAHLGPESGQIRRPCIVTHEEDA